jgi:hypothetical protein
LERMRSPLGFLRSYLLLAGLLACGDVGLEPLPLEITLQADRTMAAPDEVITFVVIAQGGDLVGVTIDYGDETAELFGTGGARTARRTFTHAYSDAGTYQVRAKVIDAVAGEREASVEIRVQ